MDMMEDEGLQGSRPGNSVCYLINSIWWQSMASRQLRVTLMWDSWALFAFIFYVLFLLCLCLSEPKILGKIRRKFWNRRKFCRSLAVLVSVSSKYGLCFHHRLSANWLFVESWNILSWEGLSSPGTPKSHPGSSWGWDHPPGLCPESSGGKTKIPKSLPPPLAQLHPFNCCTQAIPAAFSTNHNRALAL